MAVTDMEAKIEAAMKQAEKIEAKQIKADQKELEAEAEQAAKDAAKG